MKFTYVRLNANNGQQSVVSYENKFEAIKAENTVLFPNVFSADENEKAFNMYALSAYMVKKNMGRTANNADLWRVYDESCSILIRLSAYKETKAMYRAAEYAFRTVSSVGHDTQDAIAWTVCGLSEYTGTDIREAMKSGYSRLNQYIRGEKNKGNNIEYMEISGEDENGNLMNEYVALSRTLLAIESEKATWETSETGMKIREVLKALKENDKIKNYHWKAINLRARGYTIAQISGKLDRNISTIRDYFRMIQRNTEKIIDIMYPELMDLIEK